MRAVIGKPFAMRHTAWRIGGASASRFAKRTTRGGAPANGAADEPGPDRPRGDAALGEPGIHPGGRGATPGAAGATQGGGAGGPGPAPPQARGGRHPKGIGGDVSRLRRDDWQEPVVCPVSGVPGPGQTARWWSMSDFYPGDRVRVTLGTNIYTGTVVYRRHGPPDYPRPGVYSVRLDHVTRPDYTGTVVRAEDVTEDRS